MIATVMAYLFSHPYIMFIIVFLVVFATDLAQLLDRKEK